ncbi:MAG: Sec-independent protein translocase protein TatB [Methylococcales bacterium]|nr:Sec-independent protein translocase protein TatB [Methylococcales bacterium]
MFEVGFSELLMVGLVALLVIGPEKLPKAARIAGFWLGKARSMLAGVQAEIRQELMVEEMRQLARQHLDNEEMQQTVNDSEAAIQDIEATLQALPEAKPGRHNDEPA